MQFKATYKSQLLLKAQEPQNMNKKSPGHVWKKVPKDSISTTSCTLEDLKALTVQEGRAFFQFFLYCPPHQLTTFN